MPRLTGTERQGAIDFFRDSRTDQLSHIDLSVTIGERVPRNIALYELPDEILSLAPSYRGLRYARSREAIYIIDPATLTVIDVISLTGGATAELDLSASEIELVRNALSQATINSDAPLRLGLGAELPADFELSEFPESVREQIPALSSYRYVRTGGEILVVDPGDRNVELIIPLDTD